jgi:23S rRNA (adenine2503-C2)-methyltransferase
MGVTLPTVPLSESAGLPLADAALRRHLLGMDLAEVEGWMVAAGEQRFRAKQILDWVYRKHVTDFDAMSNLSKELRTWLSAGATICTSSLSCESVATDGTRKLLLALPDGAAVETVWIPAESRNTACISSQVGCPVGCRFCASGLDGVERNLTTGEIVEQTLRISALIDAVSRETTASRTDANTERDGVHGSATGSRLSNIVLMGMGEPLANYKNVIKAIRIMNAPWGLGVGARKITLSTVGLPAQIRKLAEEDLQINLALSLHAPFDALRHELIPWGKGVPIADLIDACRYYFERTGREVTFEYVLLTEVNDRPEHAEALVKLARKVRANVNLLRYNPVPGLPYRRPSSEEAFAFQKRVRERGVNVHIRTSRGIDANAACGQLRRAALQGRVENTIANSESTNAR